MNLDSIDWDEDLPPASPEEEYQALRRAIQRTDGFGLLFVQCAPAKGHEIIKQIKEDLPQKKVEVLSLKEPIRNLYERVEALPNRNEIDVLFIEGLEYSIYEYEDVKRHLGWTTEEIQSYSWKGVPHILTNLNQQRERFRDNFQACFVFLVPPFVLKYVIHRAPDFFDWRSGAFQFRMDADQIQHEIQHAWIPGDYRKYRNLSSQERLDKIFHIQILIEEGKEQPLESVDLYAGLGDLFAFEGNCKASILSYEKVLESDPDEHNKYKAWNNRGIELSKLERYEEALSSFSHAAKIDPTDYRIWHNQGLILSRLGRYKEAISFFDEALKLNFNNYKTWFKRGVALYNLGKYRQAIKSYDKALGLRTDDCQIWYNRGNSFGKLKQYKKAIKDYNKAIKLKPDYDNAWFIQGFTWIELGQNVKAIECFDRVLMINPDYYLALYGKACLYSRLGQSDQSIENLQQAIQINADECCDLAKNDSDFDTIRDDPRFQTLIS